MFAWSVLFSFVLLEIKTTIQIENLQIQTIFFMLHCSDTDNFIFSKKIFYTLINKIEERNNRKKYQKSITITKDLCTYIFTIIVHLVNPY